MSIRHIAAVCLALLPMMSWQALAGTPVTEVYPLFELPSLRKLGLQACEVADVGPLIARGVAVHGIRPPERSWRDLAEDLLRRG